MFKYLLISCILILSSCKSNNHIDPEFEPYVESFRQNALKYNVPVDLNLTIEFGTISHMKDEVVAVCHWSGRIEVRKSYWTQYDWLEREQLLYHELGHCVLNLDHVSTWSIMFPNMLPERFYQQYRESLIKELFTGAR